MARSEIVNENWIKVDEPIDLKKQKVLANVKRHDKTVNTKKAASYMSNPDTIKFTQAMVDRAFPGTKKLGRPYAFDNVETLENDVREYIQLCYDTSTVPTVASASLWLGCDRDTLYAHSNNSNSPFSGTCKNLIQICHLAMENGAVQGGINPVLYMFLSKNYFGLKDDKNITVTPVNQSQVNTSATMEALQKQIEEETTINADYTEK